MKYLIILLLLISSCDNNGEDYKLFGVLVYVDIKDQPPKEELKHATLWYIDQLSQESGYSHTKLIECFKELVYIRLIGHPIEKIVQDNGKIQYISGRYNYNKRHLNSASIEIWYKKNISYSSWFHELMHHYLRHLITKMDSDHNHTSEWWLWIKDIKEEYQEIR